MVSLWVNCVFPIFFLSFHQNTALPTNGKRNAGGLDAQKSKEVRKAVSQLLEHKIGTKLKEAAKEVKTAVDNALGKHLNHAHHILSHKDADVVVMDPKLSKLVKNAIKEGNKQHHDAKTSSNARDTSLPPPAYHGVHHTPILSHHHPHAAQQQLGAHQQQGVQTRYPQRTGYQQGLGYQPRQSPSYQQQPQGYYPSPYGHHANQGLQGNAGYLGDQTQTGVLGSPGSPTPGYSSVQGYSGYPANQSYQTPGVPAAPNQGYYGQGYGAPQLPYMQSGCPQACQQICPIMCPRKCCSDKRHAVAKHKKSKVHHHGKYQKRHGKNHYKKEHGNGN